MVANNHNSGQADLLPGGSQQILNYCAQYDSDTRIPTALQLTLSARRVNAVEIAATVQRDVKATITWTGDRGGGEVVIDVGRGTTITVPGSNIGVVVNNLSDAVPGGAGLPDNFQTYHVEACVGRSSSEGRGPLPVFTQLLTVAALAEMSERAAIPAYSRRVRAYATDAIGLPATATIAFWSAWSLVDVPGNMVYQESAFGDLLVPAGAEYIQIRDVGLAARTVRLVHEIGL